MKTSRIVLGLLLLLPTPFLLIAMVWVGGLARIATQPTELDAIARAAAQKLPPFADQSIELFRKRPKALKDANARQWLAVLQKAKLKPSDILGQTGVVSWAHQEFSNLSGKLHTMLQGEAISRELTVEFGGLKRSLASRRVDDLLKRLLLQMPRCTRGQSREWALYQINPKKGTMPPACHPGVLMIPSILRSKQSAIIQMPNQIDLLEAKPELLQAFQYFGFLPWLLFLLPGFLVLLGAAFLGRGMRGFCLWFGGATLLGGLLALPTPYLFRDVLLKAVFLESWAQQIRSQLPLTQPTFHEWLFQQVLPLVRSLTEPIFASVETMGMGVCVAGVVCMGLAFLFKPKDD